MPLKSFFLCSCLEIRAVLFSLSARSGTNLSVYVAASLPKLGMAFSSVLCTVKGKEEGGQGNIIRGAHRLLGNAG